MGEDRLAAEKQGWRRLHCFVGPLVYVVESALSELGNCSLYLLLVAIAR
jgi:hypothetical protein